MPRMTNFRSAAIATGNAINDSAYDNVKIVADNMTAVVPVADALDAGAFDVVTDNVAYVVAVANNIADVVTAAGLEVAIQSVVADKATLDSIYADKATLDSIFADKTKLDSLFADKATLDSLYEDKTTLDRLYASIDNVDAIIPHLNEVDIVANNIAVVADIGSSIGNVNAVAETVVPNIVEILQADDNAVIATTKAGEALTSADNASTSEANALASENKAEKWAEEDENLEVETGKYSAKHWAEKAKDWVVGSTVDDTTPQVDKSYSGSKVEAELLERDSRLGINEAKLTTIEVGATADQTAEEIEALYEGLADTNKYTDAEKTKVVNMPANTDLILGTTTLTRYDKILGSMDILDMEYLNGDLITVRYTGDNNVNVFCRDVLAYTAGDLTTVKHYYNTADLVTESGLTTLSYDVDKNLVSSNYIEG